MISRLKGVLLEKQPPHILVDVNGVGYEVLAPMTTFYGLPALNSPVILHTQFIVSENSQQLYGFASQDDRALFRLLIKVNGVGPKMALAILSGMELNELVRCMLDGNVNALVKVPGVGKKTAERLLIEMKDRLKDWDVGAAVSSGSSGIEPTRAVASTNSVVADAESALIALGYKPTEAAKAISQVMRDENLTQSEEIIRKALRSMLPA